MFGAGLTKIGAIVRAVRALCKEPMINLDSLTPVLIDTTTEGKWNARSEAFSGRFFRFFRLTRRRTRDGNLVETEELDSLSSGEGIFLCECLNHFGGKCGGGGRDMLIEGGGKFETSVEGLSGRHVCLCGKCIE